MIKKIAYWIAFIANIFATATGLTLIFSEALMPGAVLHYNLVMVLLLALFIVSGWTGITAET